MNASQRKTLRSIAAHRDGLLRSLMDPQEIKDARALVRLGYVLEGHSDDKRATRQYSVTLQGLEALRSSETD